LCHGLFNRLVKIAFEKKRFGLGSAPAGCGNDPFVLLEEQQVGCETRSHRHHGAARKSSV
jgi:hypothetical protein